MEKTICPSTVCALCERSIEPTKNPKGEILWRYGHIGLPLTDGRVCNDCLPEVINARGKEYE